MNPKCIIARLLNRFYQLYCKWDFADKDAVQEAQEFLDRPTTETLRLNQEGRCDHCGTPRFAHGRGWACPDAEAIQRMEECLTRWHRAVKETQVAYDRAREHERRLHAMAKRGKASREEVDRAHDDADEAWGRYQAAIRRSDREARRCWSDPDAGVLVVRRE